MKTTIAIVGISLILAVGIGGFLDRANADSPGAAPDRLTILSVACPTGTAATVSSASGRLSGYLDGFYLTVAGSTDASGTVSIATSSSYGDLAVARTIYSKTFGTAGSGFNGYYAIRQQAKDTSGDVISGEYLPISLFNDIVTLACTNWSITSATVRVTLCIRRD